MTETGAPAPAGHGHHPHRLSHNELPQTPLADLDEALRPALREPHRYPDPYAGELAEAVARACAVPAGDIVVGPGSAALLQLVVQWVAPGHGEVIHARPSFDAYRLIVHCAGARPVEVPLRDHRHDLPRMLRSITPATRALIVCNPHNPTGTVAAAADLAAFLRAVPERVVVVLDEAYREFADPGATADGGALYRDLPNLVVLRSFSKAYGLAGLRVGYALTHPDTARTLLGRLLPFSVSSVAQAAARAALARGPEALRQAEHVVAERDRLTARLREQGWPVVPSAANFLWLPLGTGAEPFAEAAARHGLLVRAVPGEGVRTTVGGAAANDALLRFTAGRRPPTGTAPADGPDTRRTPAPAVGQATGPGRARGRPAA
ncbi:aminotransferase class I/II-fold pyridoxal phosphate-dependent enzyme [Streptomyces actuosus]|uniref:Aminotransferase n=1 Tax=Streptomyces actuosus TaxID=1885 RepID=A0ABS2VJP8_STRAS|nr:aminotransferase class I/II-fold pyridoxal phosphate-dependent enzyme [Streptomyces actuosus]MBN0043316.1 aminotransferase class I/II-fold pyridoxal phosphate-dependent enzyme [Streptomyces actuosus]